MSSTPQPAPHLPPTPRKHSRRWFLKGLLGVGAVAAAGKGVDWILPRTLCRAGEWHGPVTDHFDGTYFYNPEPQLPMGTREALRWLTERQLKGEYPEITHNTHTPDLAPVVDGKQWEVTMVNHSTMLIRVQGLNILTDPIWSDYTSPVQGLGPRRKRPVGITWDALPPIDVCLISHDHYDHFDVNSLRRLEERDHPHFIVPLGLKSLLKYHCGNGLKATELDWWQSIALGKLTCYVVPARHWSKRYRSTESSNRSLWCGFYLKSPGGPSIYFAGDTARTTWFRSIYRRLGAPDVALLPIGAYRPEWIRNNHTNPADAVEAMQALHTPLAIACHFGTWQLANEGYEETLQDLRSALHHAGIPAERFPAPDNGQTIRGCIQ
ncbi:MAG: MBL fold metallo-hydrolase [Akkermansia sp.]|nr:MBL fold metallo-hydrolase [Akkermansia sp.]